MSATLSDKLVNFFWKRVNRTDQCWEWRTGNGKRPQKYGSISLYGGPESGIKCISAHRASWIIHNGNIGDGLFVLHKCDNPACVRPDHLYLGTQSDNIKEAYSKGRKRSGLAIFQSRKTHCPHGHAYDEKNTGHSFTKGKFNRYCRACSRERARKQRRERAA